MKGGYRCLILKPINAKMAGKKNWTNLKCQVEVKTSGESRIISHFHNDNLSFGMLMFY
jgi:hypothetical protein